MGLHCLVPREPLTRAKTAGRARNHAQWAAPRDVRGGSAAGRGHGMGRRHPAGTMPFVPGSQRGLYRGLPREVAVLSAISFTVALGFGIVAPAIPEFARQFGVSTAAA